MADGSVFPRWGATRSLSLSKRSPLFTSEKQAIGAANVPLGLCDLGMAQVRLWRGPGQRELFVREIWFNPWDLEYGGGLGVWSGARLGEGHNFPEVSLSQPREG